MATTWREYMAPIIAAVLQEHPNDTRERRKALRDAYPAGERAHHPYKVWLDEIARQTGKKPNPVRSGNKPAPGQLKLMESYHA